MPEYIPRHDYQLDDEEFEDGEFECGNGQCGHMVEEDGALCKDCMLEAVEDEKADRIRKGEW